MVYDSFNVFLIRLASILLRIIVSMFIRDSWPVIFFFFPVASLSGFVKSTWKCSLLFSFFNKLEKEGISFSLNIWWNLPMRPSGPGVFFVRRFFDFWYRFDLYRFFTSSWFSLGKLYFCRFIYLFYVIEFGDVQLFMVISYDLYFCVISVNVFSFWFYLNLLFFLN